MLLLYASHRITSSVIALHSYNWIILPARFRSRWALYWRARFYFDENSNQLKVTIKDGVTCSNLPEIIPQE